MVLLKNDQFLVQLAGLFERSSKKGSVFVTYKRYSFPDNLKRKRTAKGTNESSADPSVMQVDEPIAKEDDKEYKLLARATLGNSKISTLVDPKDSEKFREGCSNVFKVHMTSLKKKERTKKGAAAGGTTADSTDKEKKAKSKKDQKKKASDKKKKASKKKGVTSGQVAELPPTTNNSSAATPRKKGAAKVEA